MDEPGLIARLRRIEALFARPGSEGERAAAASAAERIRARLRELEQLEPPVEYKFTLPDAWSHRLLVALLRRYGIQPYRYKRQRRTTIMARVSRRFVAETLWPEFEEFPATLLLYLKEVTQRVISEALEVAKLEPEEKDG